MSRCRKHHTWENSGATEGRHFGVRRVENNIVGKVLGAAEGGNFLVCVENTILGKILAAEGENV